MLEASTVHPPLRRPDRHQQDSRSRDLLYRICQVCQTRGHNTCTNDNLSTVYNKKAIAYETMLTGNRPTSDSTCDAPDAAAASFVLASLAAAATTAVAAEKGDKDQTSKSRLKQDRSSRGSVVFGSLDGNVTDVMIEDEGGGAETLDDVRGL